MRILIVRLGALAMPLLLGALFALFFLVLLLFGLLCGRRLLLLGFNDLFLRFGNDERVVFGTGDVRFELIAVRRRAIIGSGCMKNRAIANFEQQRLRIDNLTGRDSLAARLRLQV